LDNLRPQEDYEYFCNRVRLWANYFGLHDWMITTEFAELDEGISADNSSDPAGRISAIRLNKKMTSYALANADKRELVLDASAFHEVMHTIISELSTAANVGRPPYVTRPIEEAIVRRFVNCVHTELLRLWEAEKPTKNR